MSDTALTPKTVFPAVPAPLYKFSSVAGAKSILEGSCLWTKSPLEFNDPFEVFPAFDEERKNEVVLSRKRFYQRIGYPSGGDLIDGGNEEMILVENWVDFSAHHHDEFFASIYDRFRVLCLSEAVDQILLWSHYACSHAGIAVGFDLNTGGFPLGRFAVGVPVKYVTDRTNLKLPIEYYSFTGLRFVDPSPAPRGYSKTKNGMLISKNDEEAKYLDCLHTLIQHKFDAWRDEQERRFLYDLSLPGEDGLEDSDPDRDDTIHKSAAFSPESVTEIVFGYKCPVADIESLAPVIEKFPNVKLYYVDLHPMEFKVRVHEGDLRQVIATHRERERSSFRFRGSPR